ncbi:MAG: N-acetyltransferase family protein, partial [Halobaculum sp.]
MSVAERPQGPRAHPTNPHGMEYTVRRAERTDIAGIRRATANAWREGYREILGEETVAGDTRPVSETYPADRLDRKLADERLRYLVGDYRGDVMGTTTCNWGPDNTHAFVPDGDLQLRAVYVDPAYWRQGVATRLIETGLAELPTDPDRVWVEVLADNDAGIGLYRSLGF